MSECDDRYCPCRHATEWAAYGMIVVHADDDPEICKGWNWPQGSVCGNECDPGKLCDTCAEQAALAAKEREAGAYREEHGVEKLASYPHLTD